MSSWQAAEIETSRSLASASSAAFSFVVKNVTTRLFRAISRGNGGRPLPAGESVSDMLSPTRKLFALLAVPGQSQLEFPLPAK
jgi:hypothetical protein